MIRRNCEILTKNGQTTGKKWWLINGDLHRENGPAYEDPDNGYVQYWLNNNYYPTEEQWRQALTKLQTQRENQPK